MAKIILVWSTILLLLTFVATHLLSNAEAQCRERCALNDKNYTYTVPKGRRHATRPAVCRCSER